MKQSSSSSASDGTVSTAGGEGGGGSPCLSAVAANLTEALLLSACASAGAGGGMSSVEPGWDILRPPWLRPPPLPTRTGRGQLHLILRHHLRARAERVVLRVQKTEKARIIVADPSREDLVHGLAMAKAVNDLLNPGIVTGNIIWAIRVIRLSNMSGGMAFPSEENVALGIGARGEEVGTAGREVRQGASENRVFAVTKKDPSDEGLERVAIGSSHQAI
jgi:hypothetical protein